MTTTSITPMMTIDAIVARGTLRRGFSVSSASGTAASQPVRPCTVKTIASAKPLPVATMPPGLNPYVNVSKRETSRPGIGQPPQAEGEDDKELHGPDDHDRPDRERYSVIPGQGNERQSTITSIHQWNHVTW